MPYLAAPDRYDAMTYRRCGRSGLQLPAISLGLWNNFGDNAPLETQRAILRRAFDRGITHIDLANNYGPPPGAAESNFGRILRRGPRGPYRDELIISTKAGYDMWPGPYGEWGSRKYLLASLDQSLQRMGLDYVDIFYSHRLDPDTPLEETLGAVDTAVRQGKALYAGISSYSGPRTTEAVQIFRELGTPLLIHQPQLQPPQPLDRGGPARRAGGGGRRLHRLLAARPGHAHRQVPRRRPRAVARRRGHVPLGATTCPTRTSRACARSTRSPSSAASRSRRWRSRGCCATRASRPRSSAPARWSSSTTPSARSTTSSSAPGELEEIDRHAVEAGINTLGAASCGLASARRRARRGPSPSPGPRGRRAAPPRCRRARRAP